MTGAKNFSKHLPESKANDQYASQQKPIDPPPCIVRVTKRRYHNKLNDMDPSMFISIVTTLLLLLNISLLHISVVTTSPSSPQLCHDDERSALLQFKEGFVIDVQASIKDPLAYPKVESWKLVGDCCLWDGVECDDVSGHVVGIDLSSSCLYGSINSSSGLFRLFRLRKLNLAFNHFNSSVIPSNFGYLSKLTSLNLSNSFFSGQIPSNISDFSQLSFLDLSDNDQLSLVNPDFRSLIQNLTSLQVLNLKSVHIPSPIPDNLSNISSLESLRLINCGLYGKFPVEIFQLPKLKSINLILNPILTGHLPEFHSNSPLEILALGLTSFSGEIPESIGNFKSLTSLSLQRCNFVGKLPSSLGNLTHLDLMSFSANPFSPQSTSSLSWIGQLNKLTLLDFAAIQLYGEIPPFIVNLTQLSDLYLGGNQLIGSISPWLMNLTQLTLLYLSGNRLLGWPILSTNSNATVQKFSELGLGSCNLDSFPDFLRSQDKLQVLDLSRNNIQGLIPKWLMNISAQTLEIIGLERNFFTGFEAMPVSFMWKKIRVIEICNNMLQASSTPIPPPSIEVYCISGNGMTGEISPSFCNLTSLNILLLQDNFFSGTIPSCLGNSVTHMEMLNLGGNNLHGMVPETFTEASKFQMIALNDNQLEGEVPRTLANCKMLEFLNLENNQFVDVFPSWLGTLPNLKVLILRSNQFHGTIKGPETVFDFQKLHIIDLSQNNFSGRLPTNYFLNWEEMKMENVDQSSHKGKNLGLDFRMTNLSSNASYTYSMSITNKGVDLNYTRIVNFFIAIDLSCNRFEGDIPKVIGNLKGLNMLNLSYNNLNGRIPSSLGNLTKLESLDLSGNRLSGEIPSQLVDLNFLAVFNVSHNNLTGPLPIGKQFDTFQNDSYEGNTGLCGKILQKKCANSEAPPPALLASEDHQQSSSSLFGFDRELLVIGYGCGLVFGFVIGHIVAIRKYDSFMKTSKIRPY